MYIDLSLSPSLSLFSLPLAMSGTGQSSDPEVVLEGSGSPRIRITRGGTCRGEGQ